jgi:hypothetical protein
MPTPLRNALRIERYGSPFSGGFMSWPLKWLIPVETALNVYNTLTAVNHAMNTYEGEHLAKWQTANARLVQSALDIQAIREEVEASG